MKKKSVFGFETPEQSPGFLMWKTMVTWRRLILKVLGPYDISHAQFVIMAVTRWLHETGQDATQIKIATLSGIDKMTVSKSLKKLVALKLARRSENEQDTRAKLVELTAKGKKLIAKLVPLVEGVDADFFGILNATDTKSLLTVLDTLTNS